MCEAEAESEKEELGMLYLENDNFISTSGCLVPSTVLSALRVLTVYMSRYND